MKRFFLGFFIFVFVFNAVSLSAYASVCPYEMKTEKKTEAASPCHEGVMSEAQKSPNTSKTSKVGHCKGLCFCQHAALGQNVAPFRAVDVFGGLGLVKSLIPASDAQNFKSISSFPLERPPKQIS